MVWIRKAAESSSNAILSCEVVFADDIRINVCRRNARRGQSLGLDFLLDCLVVHFLSFFG